MKPARKPCSDSRSRGPADTPASSARFLTMRPIESGCSPDSQTVPSARIARKTKASAGAAVSQRRCACTEQGAAWLPEGMPTIVPSCSWSPLDVGRKRRRPSGPKATSLAGRRRARSAEVLRRRREGTARGRVDPRTRRRCRRDGESLRRRGRLPFALVCRDGGKGRAASPGWPDALGPRGGPRACTLVRW